MRDFLATRRARITPEQAGLRLSVATAASRVCAVRELAPLAGASVDYLPRTADV